MSLVRSENIASLFAGGNELSVFCYLLLLLAALAFSGW